MLTNPWKLPKSSKPLTCPTNPHHSMFGLTYESQARESRSPRRERARSRTRSPPGRSSRRRSYSPRSRSRERRRSRSPIPKMEPGAAIGAYGGAPHGGGRFQGSDQDRSAARASMLENIKDSSQQDRRVYVGNLSYDVKWHHLKDFMRTG